MRIRRVIPLLIVILVAVAVAVFLLVRARQDASAAYGSAIAICPGPDLYGYSCASADAISYVDAQNDTQLYADDGVLTLDLPFPFTFYGETYEEVNVVTNGFIHFGPEPIPYFFNGCLGEGALETLGEVIAPYWDDLDVRFIGFIEYETVGEEPNRVFVIEWDDIPKFGGDDDDTVTFEVQLYEGSNDIVFLYQDVIIADGANGSSATIGQQSEQHQIALEYSCNQPALPNFSGVRIVHPEEPNEDLAQGLIPTDIELIASAEPLQLAVKDDSLLLIEQLTLRGTEIIPQLRNRWLNGSPARDAEWQFADLAGDGRQGLVYLWRGPAAFPELNQLAVLSQDADGNWQVVFNQMLGDRIESFTKLTLVDVVDVTGDGAADVLLLDEKTGRLRVLTNDSNGDYTFYSVDGNCRGDIQVKDTNGDGQLDIIRSLCNGPGRLIQHWWLNGFIER